jgi:hypothetical protein
LGGTAIDCAGNYFRSEELDGLNRTRRFLLSYANEECPNPTALCSTDLETADQSLA